MSQRYDELPVSELQALKAPLRSDIARQRSRQRILARAQPLLAQRRRSASSWEVLAAWARPGLVAASIALAILAATMKLSGDARSVPQPVPLDDVLAEGTNGSVPALLVAMSEPDADAVVAIALLENNGGGALPDEEPQRR
ncbi:MAG: hypothetical protein AMS25_03410 [Gemmatimonas sp. SM23_52]|nr:MAG: hypothetical protein AMS25_03410 [Gemmatimonas sp. SM23_52]